MNAAPNPVEFEGDMATAGDVTQAEREAAIGKLDMLAIPAGSGFTIKGALVVQADLPLAARACILTALMDRAVSAHAAALGNVFMLDGCPVGSAISPFDRIGYEARLEVLTPDPDAACSPMMDVSIAAVFTAQQQLEAIEKLRKLANEACDKAAHRAAMMLTTHGEVGHA